MPLRCRITLHDDEQNAVAVADGYARFGGQAVQTRPRRASRSSRCTEIDLSAVADKSPCVSVRGCPRLDAFAGAEATWIRSSVRALRVTRRRLIFVSHFSARPIDFPWYFAAVVTLSALLLISGVGIWRRWPASRYLNILAAGAIAAILGANLIDGLVALILSAVCLTRRSVNTFFAGMRSSDPAAEIVTPRSLVWFSWLLLVAYVAGCWPHHFGGTSGPQQ